MIAIAQFVAISCYLGAAALAAVPFARPVRAPVAGVLTALGFGIAAHVFALLSFAFRASTIPMTGLGPSLSFAGVVLAITLFIVGSAACSFATSMYMLAALRAVQGLGAGGLFTLWVLFNGGVDTGWTFYTPFSTAFRFSIDRRNSPSKVSCTICPVGSTEAWPETNTQSPT